MANGPTTAIKLQLIYGSQNYGGGTQSEAWWFPGKNEADANNLADELAELRSKAMGFLTGVKTVRMSAYTGQPNAVPALQRKLVLIPRDNGGLGWYKKLPGVDPNTPELVNFWAAYKSVGARVRLSFADDSFTTATFSFPNLYVTAPPIPGIGNFPWGDSAKFKEWASAYYGYLVGKNAARLKVLPYLKYDIIGGVNGNSANNTAGGVIIKGNFVTEFPPGRVVHIGDRFNPRGGLQRPAADRGLGTRRVLRSVYNVTADPNTGAPADSTFIEIVCSVNASGFNDPCVTPGFIAPLKKDWVQLTNYDVSLLPRKVGSRGKRRL